MIAKRNLNLILVLILFLLYSLLSPVSTLAAENLSFVHQDHLGSTILITDSTGKLISKQVYYPFGETRNEVSEVGYQVTNRQYTGQISDTDETGLYYYNARYYNPAIAKFTQADTASDGTNRYAYVGNNPLKLIDPSGHQGACPFWQLSCLKEAFLSDLNSIKEAATGFALSWADSPEETTDALALNALQIVAYGLAYSAGGEQFAEGVDATLCAATGGGSACALAAQMSGPYVRQSDNLANYQQWLGRNGVELELAPNSKIIDFGSNSGQYYAGTSGYVGSNKITLFPGQGGEYYIQPDVIIHEMGHAQAAWGQVPSNNNMLQLYANECINCAYTINKLRERGLFSYIRGEIDYLGDNLYDYRQAVWNTGGLRDINGRFVSSSQLLNMVDTGVLSPNYLRTFPNIAEENFSHSLNLVTMSKNDWYRKKLYPD